MNKTEQAERIDLLRAELDRYRAKNTVLNKALLTIEDRLSAWADTEEMWYRRATNVASETAHRNTRDNYRALIEQAVVARRH